MLSALHSLELRAQGGVHRGRVPTLHRVKLTHSLTRKYTKGYLEILFGSTWKKNTPNSDIL